MLALTISQWILTVHKMCAIGSIILPYCIGRFIYMYISEKLFFRFDGQRVFYDVRKRSDML